MERQEIWRGRKSGAAGDLERQEIWSGRGVANRGVSNGEIWSGRKSGAAGV